MAMSHYNPETNKSKINSRCMAMCHYNPDRHRFAVKKSCHATRESWKCSQELKITLRYLKGTYQSWVAAAETRQLIWASQSLLKNIVMQPGPQTLDDWRSTSGHCIYFGAILVSRCSKKQTLVANLITEAENKILVNTAAEILCLQNCTFPYIFLRQCVTTWALTRAL